MISLVHLRYNYPILIADYILLHVVINCNWKYNNAQHYKTGSHFYAFKLRFGNIFRHNAVEDQNNTI